MLATMQHTRDVRPRLRRGRRADRSGDRPREERDLPHGRRRRPRHDGARHQRRCATRCPTIRGTRCSPRRRCWTALVAKGALGAEDAARASTARSARTSRCSIPPRRDYRLVRRRGRAGSGRDPRRSRARRRSSRSCAPARIRRRSSCGRSSAISFHYSAYHLARDRRQRARRRPRDPLGLRLAAGAVRDLAGRGLARGRDAGSRRTSPPGARSRRCRCPRGCASAKVVAARGVHAPQGAYSPAARRVRRRARRCRSTAASSFPMPLLRRARSTPAPRSSRPTRCACGTWATTSAIVSFKTQAEHDRRRRARRRPARDRRGRAQLRRARDLADEGAVLARRESRRASRPRSQAKAVGRRSKRSSPSSSRRRCGCATAWCRRSPRCAAWRSAARANSSCIAIAPSRRSSRTSAWSRSASGLLPAGGGMQGVRACARPPKRRRGASGGQLDMFPFMRTYFQTIAMATVAKSALEAKELGYLRPADIVVMHPLRAAVRREGAGARARRSRATGRRCPRATSRSSARPASRRCR